MALTLATAAGMLVAGADGWLVAGMTVIWLGSLWLALPEPTVEPARVNVAQASRDAMRETIEPLGLPLLIVNGSRIVLANQAAREALGSHIVGQDARIALRHPEAMRLLEMDDGATVAIPGFTGGRSLWQLTRRRIDPQRWLIELSDRTAEADVSRAHTDFVANASHELRTPLAAIIGYVETLADEDAPVDPPTTQRFLGIVQREAKRMSSLVEDLMALSHVEAEKHDIPTERLDLTGLAARVVAEVGSIRGKERVVLREGSGELEIAGDAGQLEQLLRNLIDNALKYGDPAEAVEVMAVRSADGAVCLTVTDHGAGIASEHLPHLTRRFYRTDPGRSRAAGGTGLGLAIVKHIVERHRAQLDIASTLGEGTSVSVTFPDAAAPITAVLS
ncbi:MAG TPA: ATP-binding protein [Novosphingobium sp.]|nr:ATP-binding protein [Novosphingobium sp.]